MTSRRRSLHTLGIFVSVTFPSLVLAQEATQAPSVGKLGAFFGQFITFIDNYLVPLLFALAFTIFLFGIFRYFILGGANEEKRDEGKKFMVWGLIGFFIMVTVWGIVNLLVSSLGFGGDSRPPLPLFDTQTEQGATSNGSAFPTASPASGSQTDSSTIRKTSADPYTSPTNTGTQTTPTQTSAKTNQSPSLRSCLRGDFVCNPNDICLDSGPDSGACIDRGGFLVYRL